MDQQEYVNKTIENVNNGVVNLQEAVESLDDTSKALLLTKLIDEGKIQIINTKDNLNEFDVKKYSTIPLPKMASKIPNTEYSYKELYDNITQENFEEVLNILESFDRENEASGITRQTPFEISKQSIDALNKYLNILLTFSLGKQYDLVLDYNLSTRNHAIVFLVLKFILYQDSNFKVKWATLFDNYVTSGSMDIYNSLLNAIGNTIYEVTIDEMSNLANEENLQPVPLEQDISPMSQSSPDVPLEDPSIATQEDAVPEDMSSMSETSPDVPDEPPLDTPEDISPISETSPDVPQEPIDSSNDIEEVDLDKMQ